jgi:hypothetical protein
MSHIKKVVRHNLKLSIFFFQIFAAYIVKKKKKKKKKNFEQKLNFSFLNKKRLCKNKENRF